MLIDEFGRSNRLRNFDVSSLFGAFAASRVHGTSSIDAQLMSPPETVGLRGIDELLGSVELADLVLLVEHSGLLLFSYPLFDLSETLESDGIVPLS